MKEKKILLQIFVVFLYMIRRYSSLDVYSTVVLQYRKKFWNQEFPGIILLVLDKKV